MTSSPCLWLIYKIACAFGLFTRSLGLLLQSKNTPWLHPLHPRSHTQGDAFAAPPDLFAMPHLVRLRYAMAAAAAEESKALHAQQAQHAQQARPPPKAKASSKQQKQEQSLGGQGGQKGERKRGGGGAGGGGGGGHAVVENGKTPQAKRRKHAPRYDDAAKAAADALAALSQGRSRRVGGHQGQWENTAGVVESEAGPARGVRSGGGGLFSSPPAAKAAAGREQGAARSLARPPSRKAAAMGARGGGAAGGAGGDAAAAAARDDKSGKGRKRRRVVEAEEGVAEADRCVCVWVCACVCVCGWVGVWRESLLEIKALPRSTYLPRTASLFSLT